MKRLISLITITAGLICLALLIPITVHADGENSNITWTFEDGVLTISGQGDMDDYDSEPAPWQAHSNFITSLVIEPGITSIGNSAFSTLQALRSVSIPNTVTRIGNSAFYLSFWIEDIEIPSSVTSIGESAFYYCAELTNVVIPDSVTSIGSGAFTLCTGITSVTIGENVVDFGSDVFRDCYNLAEIYYNAANANDFQYEGPFTNVGNDGPEIQVIIGDNVENIPAKLFSGSSRITSVSIGSSVTSIGDEAFSRCLFTDITIPDSVRTIGGRAFSGCSALQSVTIPDSVRNLGAFAFSGCTGLTDLVLSNDLTVIEDGTFYGCTGLTDLSIPISVTNINGSAFQDCTGLTNLIIPNSVTDVEAYAFYGCTGIEYIFIGSNLKNIGYAAFGECTGLIGVHYGSRNSNPLFEHTRAFINAGADRSGIQLTIDYGVETVPAYLFYNVPKLKKLVIGSSTTSIGEYAFSGCRLTEIQYNATDCTIDPTAFYCEEPTDSWIIASILAGVNSVPSGLLDAQQLASINVSDDNINFSSYQGILYNKSGKNLIRCPRGYSRSAELMGNLRTIEAGAFSDCINLLRVTVPEKVTLINERAFENCPKLKKVIFEKNQPLIDETCFDGTTCKGCYPYKNATWDTLPSLSDESHVTWIPYSLGTVQEAVLVQMPDKTTYRRFEQLDLTGLEFRASFTDGLVWVYDWEEIESVEYAFTSFGNTTATAYYGGIPIEFTVKVYEIWKETVDPAEYPESEHPYADNLDQTYTYQYPGAVKLELTFSNATNVENLVDYLYISDSANLLGTYTGSQLAGQTIVIDDDTAYIRLVSDDDTGAYGFSLSEIVAHYREGLCETGHKWGNPEYTWSEDYHSATASRVCRYCDEIDAETVQTEEIVITPITCTDTGQAEYYAWFTNPIFVDQNKTVNYPALGHNYEASEWTWTGFESASVLLVCQHDNSHTETVNAAITSQTIPATCETAGKTVYTATATFDGREYTDEKEDPIPAFGHAYSLTGWTWNGLESATASFVCQHDESHVKTIDAVITSETVPATCETAGKTVYTATVILGGNVYVDEKEEEIPALGHNYAAGEWTWTGFESASVVLVCQHDNSHTETVNAVITSQTIPATCEIAGKTMYTATATFDGKEYTDEKEDPISAFGHAYSLTGWTWNGLESATASFVCQHDESHVETIDAVITSETVPATCETAGKTVYSAKVILGGQEYVNKKVEEEAPALGHNYRLAEWTWTGYEAAAASFICEHDESHTQTVTAAVTVEMTPASCETDGKTVYTATVVFGEETFTDMKKETIPSPGHTAGSAVTEGKTEATCTKVGGYDEVVYCTVCNEELSRTHHSIPKLGHDYELSGWTWASDYSTAKASFVCKNDPAHKKTVNATITSKNGSDGKSVYTATVSFNGQTYTDTNGESVFRNPFTDVPNDASYLSSLAWAVQNGIISGTSATTFSPNASCTRYQFAVMLYKLAGKPSVTGVTLPFTDVPESKSYYKAVCWAYSNKIISGTSATTFSPDAEVTRYQVVAVLYKMAGKPKVSGTNLFTDVPDNASYYNAVMWAVQQGITKGTSTTKFSPMATCQRYQMVVFLNKFNRIYHIK